MRRFSDSSAIDRLKVKKYNFGSPEPSPIQEQSFISSGDTLRLGSYASSLVRFTTNQVKKGKSKK